jgi:excisionase family DNA binding protein
MTKQHHISSKSTPLSVFLKNRKERTLEASETKLEPKTQASEVSSNLKYVTKEEIAAYFQVSVGLMHRLMAHNGMPHIRIGRTVRFHIPDVIAWFETNGMKI